MDTLHYHVNLLLFLLCIMGGGGGKFSQMGPKAATKFDPMGLIFFLGGGGSNLV